jgi:hypothetical protein
MIEHKFLKAYIELHQIIKRSTEKLATMKDQATKDIQKLSKLGDVLVEVDGITYLCTISTKGTWTFSKTVQNMQATMKELMESEKATNKAKYEDGDPYPVIKKK